jgi:hypothetical protein
MPRLRSMGSCPCKQPGRSITRFHSNPAGKCLAGRSALLHHLPIARAIGCALRLAAHPGQTLVQLQKDFEQVLRGRAAVFAEQIRSCHAPNLPAPPQQALQARQRTKATPLMPGNPLGAVSAPEGLWSGEHNPPWRRYPVLSYGLVVFAVLGTSAPFTWQARIASSTPLSSA